MKVEFKKTGINGEGIGYFHKKPVFCDGVLEGETAEVKITERNDRYYRAEVVEIIERSPQRVKPVCKNYQRCGGCELMICKYDQQLDIKKRLLQEALEKYAGYQGKVEDTIGSEKQLGYRNKCNLPVIERKGKLVNALYQKGTNKAVVIEHCYIHTKELEEVRCRVLDVLNKNHCLSYDQKTKKGIRQLVLRGFDDGFQLVLVTGQQQPSEKLLADLGEIREIVSLYQGIQTAKNPVNVMPEQLILLAGKESIQVHLDEFTLNLKPQSFFQLNQGQAMEIYRTLASLIDGQVGTIVEAYSGLGGISLYLHDKAKQIYGIEIEPNAVASASQNAKDNGFNHIHFIAGDASEQLTKLLQKQKVDILVVDPPRKGIDEKLLKTIAKKRISKILYVSCNPATLAKNIQFLNRNYRIEKVIPFDMFPQSPLAE